MLRLLQPLQRIFGAHEERLPALASLMAMDGIIWDCPDAILRKKTSLSESTDWRTL